MKNYIIRVAENRIDDDNRLRVIGTMEDGIPHWIETGIRVIPYEEPSDMTEDAWNFARRIIGYGDDALTIDEIHDCYKTSAACIFVQLSYEEAKEQYEAWKKQKDEIRLGDEVAFHFDDGRPDTIVVVTYIGEDGFIDGMDGKGTQYAHKNPKNWTKTGRHFPEVAELLNKMQRNVDDNG